MALTKDQLLEKLPARDYWLTTEIAAAFGVTIRTIQYAATRKNIGTRVRQGPRGTFVFQEHDLENLCKHIHVQVGNPNLKGQDKESMQKLASDFLKRELAAMKEEFKDFDEEYSKFEEEFATTP